MSVEENKALVRHTFKEITKGNIDVFDKVCDPAIVFHTVSGGELQGIEKFAQMTRNARALVPNVRFTIDDLIAEGDKVVARWTLSGTHIGQRHKVQPTGNKVSAWEITIFRFSGGKIVEVWERADTYGWRQQLGMIPASE
jgi:predicted ester cyclase